MSEAVQSESQQASQYSEDSKPSQAGVGTAHLSSDLTEDGKYTISGVALGAGDVTVGSSGIKKRWPADELKRAAETLEGQPLVRDHENNTDGRVGTVTRAYYKEGVGVKYEAELASHYDQLAQDIAAGIQEVSARAYHDPVEELEEDESGARVVQNVHFDNLSVVSQGASPSNTAEIGGLDISDAIAMAQGPTGGAVATLEAGSPRPDAELAGKFSEGDWVKGDSSGGTWHGKVRGVKSDGCYNEEIDGDMEVCAGDSYVYLIENYDPESGEFTDTMVAHKEGSISSWSHEENARKEYIDVMAAELEVDQDELDEVYSDWNSAVNMSASQLESWAEHECSDKASQDPEAVRNRNMHLLETNKSEWGADEIEDAKRTISFISRMSDEENEPDDPRDGPGGCPSKWAISLLNWAYNPFDSMPDEPDEEENRMHSVEEDDRSDTTTMPKETVGDTPEWEEGDMVRWQVEPDLFGKIVHVDSEKNVVMVEIMGMESGEVQSTGFTITAGFSDIKPMTVPESKADMSGHKDDEGMSESSPTTIEKEVVSELAEVGDMDINGLVMWDDRMGAISGFEIAHSEGAPSASSRSEDERDGTVAERGAEMQDGELMVELDVIEREDGSFQKTGDTVMRSMTDVDSMTDRESDSKQTDVEELKSVAGVEFDDTSSGKLDESEIPNDDYESHYLFPEDTKSDSSYPVVDADGNLRKGNVAAAHQLGARGGVSEESLREKLMALNKEWPEGERPIEFDSDEEENSAADTGDDVRNEPSTVTVAALSSNNNTNITRNSDMSTTINYDNATDDDIDEMDDPVVIEQDAVEELRDKADEADELSERLEQLNSSLDELAENQEKIEDVDEDRLDELREYDEAVVLTEDEHEELQGLVDDIGQVFAEELAEYSAFEADELQERFTPLELRDKVEEHDEASVSEELGESGDDPEPEGGSVDPEELEGDGSEAEQEATEEELREAVAEHLEDGKMHRQAEKVREGDISLDEMGIDSDAVLSD